MGSEDEPLSYNPWVLFKKFRRAKIITVEPVIFLFTFGMYLLYFLNQQYYFNQYALEKMNSTEREFIRENGSSCINISNLDDYTGINDSYKQVEDEANSLSLYCTLPNKILSIIATLILGPLSDRYGRRIIIVIVAVAQLLQGAISLCIVFFKLNLFFFILGGAVAGLSGDFTALLTVCFAYVSDFSSKKTRTVRIGVAEAMLFLSGMISTGAGGFWFAKLNCQLKYPIVMFMACNVLILAYTLLYLPESLTSEERKIKMRGKPRGVFALLAGFKIIFFQISKYVSSAWKIWASIFPVFIMVVVMGTTYIGVYFFKALNWGSTRIGFYLSTCMGSHLLVLMFILPLLTALKFPDPLISLIGVLFNIFMNLFIGLSHKTYQVFIVAVVQGMDAMMVPPLRGYMSKLVAVEDQVESLASLLAGIAFPKILPLTLEHDMNPGTSYIIMSAVGLVTLPFLGVLLLSWCIDKVKTITSIPLKEDDDPKTPLLYSKDPAIQNDPIPYNTKN